MTCYDAWLSKPEAPKEAAAWFPDGQAAFFYLCDAIRSGRLVGEQVDHLVWRTRVSRADLERILLELCGPEGEPVRKGYEPPQAVEQRAALRRFVASLAPTDSCYFWADEF